MYRCRQVVSQCSSSVKSNLGQSTRGTRNAGQSTTRRYASDHGYERTPVQRPATLNDMPTPKGSWAQEHARNQSKYNMHLAAGLAFTGITLFAGYQSGSFYLNYKPDLKATKVNVLTHEQVRLNAEKAAQAAIEEPVPEPEDIAPATFEAVPETPAEVVAVPEAVSEVATDAAAAPEAVVEAVVEAVAVPEAVVEAVATPEAVVEAVAAPEAAVESVAAPEAAVESGPSDPSEGEVQSEATVSDLTVEVEVVAVTESEPVALSEVK